MEEGLATLAEIQHIDPEAKLIVVTGREERQFAMQAVAQGAYDFFAKPIEVEELKTGKLGPPSLFGAAEYAKDGLIAITELLGRTPGSTGWRT